MPTRKPTRRGIRHRAARNRSGGTVYQSDAQFTAALDALNTNADQDRAVASPETADASDASAPGCD